MFARSRLLPWRRGNPLVPLPERVRIFPLSEVVLFPDTLLPLHMPAGRVAFVYLLTAAMCAGSGALAMRKLRGADPAEIF